MFENQSIHGKEIIKNTLHQNVLETDVSAGHVSFNCLVSKVLQDSVKNKEKGDAPRRRTGTW
ncbi:MAG: hypothetical protein LKK11_07085 [Acidaminococcus sp.]|nr:hypothetical protein [Acidaminococcus sp.]